MLDSKSKYCLMMSIGSTKNGQAKLNGFSQSILKVNKEVQTILSKPNLSLDQKFKDFCYDIFHTSIVNESF